MQKYTNLEIWKKSYSLALQIYGISKTFPNDEKFGLISQIRRASVSIPINIAEGAGRATEKDFANFIQIAIGSANEVECELMLAKDLGYVNEDIFQNLYDQLREVKIMMIYFRKTLLK